MSESVAEHAKTKDLAVDRFVGFLTPIGLMGLFVYFLYVTLIKQFGTECGIFSPFTRVIYQLIAISVLVSGCHMRMSQRCKECSKIERTGWSVIRIGSLGLFFYLAFKILESYADGVPLVSNRVIDGSILLMWVLLAVSAQNYQASKNALPT